MGCCTSTRAADVVVPPIEDIINLPVGEFMPAMEKRDAALREKARLEFLEKQEAARVVEAREEEFRQERAETDRLLKKEKKKKKKKQNGISVIFSINCDRRSHRGKGKH
jgi:hypothetical protein